MGSHTRIEAMLQKAARLMSQMPEGRGDDMKKGENGG
jgi:hypothetical protein